jgi:hypothetical protein
MDKWICGNGIIHRSVRGRQHTTWGHLSVHPLQHAGVYVIDTTTKKELDLQLLTKVFYY